MTDTKKGERGGYRSLNDRGNNELVFENTTLFKSNNHLVPLYLPRTFLTNAQKFSFQPITYVAGAHETSRSIGAFVITATISNQAFVDIYGQSDKRVLRMLGKSGRG